MEDPASWDLRDAACRIRENDTNLTCIDMFCRPVLDSELLEVIECMKTIHHTVATVELGSCEISDTTAIPIAQFIAVDKTVKRLYLGWNNFTYPSFVAFSHALYTNTTLSHLSLYNKTTLLDDTLIRLFANAWRINPVHPDDMYLHLFAYTNSLTTVREIAEKSTSPSMLEFMLYSHFEIN